MPSNKKQKRHHLSRSEMMAQVKSKNTGPEIFVRSCLHRAGLRFRIHRKELPGCPDIVFPSRQIAIFINGCFWHGHVGCKRAKIPSTNRDFWEPKLMRNVERDAINYKSLKAMGWKVLIVWACEISCDKMEDLILEIKRS